MNAIGGRKTTRKILLAACAAVLAGGVAASGSELTWSGANANNSLWTTATNWAGNTAPVAHDSLVFDDFARLTPNNDFAANTAFDGLTFAPTAGSFNLVGNQITLSGDINDNTPVLSETITLAMLLNGNRNVGVADSGLLSIGGAISGNFGITKTGGGTLLLTAANTFTGTLNITNGVVSIGADNNLGATTAAANRLIIDGGALRTTANLTINSARGILLGNASGGGGTFDVTSGTTVSYGGVIANNGGSSSLTKLSFGGLTLSGANTYTGGTYVRNGALTLNFNDAAAPASNIISPSSTLVLGGATAGLGQNNNASLIMTGKNGAASLQTFNNTNIDIYGAVINVTNGTTGGTATLNLGALTHTVGGTVVIPTATANGIVKTTTTVANTHGILGGWAVAGTPNVQRGITLGSDWATVNASGNIVAYTGYLDAPAYDGNSGSNTLWHKNTTINANADKNLRFTGTATATELRVDDENAGTTTDINTLIFATNGANHTLTIGTGNTLRLGVYGGIFKNAVGNNQLYIGGSGGVQSGTGNVGSSGIGNLTAGGPTDNTPGEIVLTLDDTANNNGGLNIESNIVDNGTGAVTLVKTGVMSVKIDGHNTYSGGTFINQGRFQLAGQEVGSPNPDGLGLGRVTIAPGSYLFVSGVNSGGNSPNSLYTGRGAIAGALANTAQNAPILNDMTISGVGTNQEGIGAIRLGNRSVMTGQIQLGGDARIGGGNGASYPAINADGTTLYVDPGNLISGKITGAFNLDIGSVASIATNFVISNPANDWTGNTSLIGRTGGTSSTTRLRLGGNEVIPDGVGKGNLNFGNSGNTLSPIILDMNGFNETVNGLSSANSDPLNVANIFIENNGFTATITGDVGSKTYNFATNTSTLTVGGFDQSATFAGTIRDFDPSASVTLPDPNTPGATVVTTPAITGGAKVALTKIGTGVQTLSGANSYTGDTNINNGALVITGQLAQNAKVNVNSSASAAGTLSGTGNVGDVVLAANVGSQKATISPGASPAIGSIGTLTLNSLTVNGGDISIDVGQGVSDVISVATSTSFNAPSTISPGPSGAAGTYTILQSGNPIVYGAKPALVAPTLTRNTFTLDTTSSPNAINLVVTGGSKSLNWTGAVNGRWDIVGFENWNDGLQAERFFNGDAVTFGDVNTNRNLTLDVTVQPGSVSFTNTSPNDYVLGGVGSIGGSANFSKSGSGSVTIAINNTYTGTTQISEGTVQVGTGGTSGSLGTGAITSDGTLIFNRSDNLTVAQTIDGNGNVRKQGAGTLRLSGVNNYTGTTSIEQGTILINNSSSLGNTPGSAVTINSGGALDLAADATANDVNFNGKAFTIAGTGVNGTGVLTNSGNTAQQNAFQAVTLSADATVGGTGRFDLRLNGGGASSTSLDLAGHTLTKVGTNQVTLVNTDVTDGNIVVNQGTFAIEAGTNVPDGTGTITYNDGTTMQFWGNTGSVLRRMVVNGAVSTGNANAGAGATVASNMTLNGVLTMNVLNAANTTSLTLTGNLSGAGALAKNGATTTLTLSGNNTYSGGTAIKEGTLIVNNTAGSATGTGPVTLGADTTLNGNGTIAGTVTASGTSHIVPGDGITTLTMGGLGLAEGTILDFEGMGTTFDQIKLTGTNTLTFSGNAVMNLLDVGQMNEGSFTLIDYSGSPIGNLAGKLTLAINQLGGLNATLIDDPVNTAIKVKLENPNGAPQWFFDGDGSWSNPSNWSSGSLPDGSTATARLLGAITAPHTITLDGDHTIGTLIFDNAQKYTIAPGTGGTLTLGDASNGGSISVVTGNHQISAAVAVAGATTVDIAGGQSLNLSGGTAIAAGQTMTKIGNGTLRVGGTANHAAGAALVARQGTVQLDSNQGTANSASGSNLALSISGNPDNTPSAVVLNSDQDLGSLTISTADAGTQTLDLHSPSGAGLFYTVRVYAADLNAAKASLSAAIQNANAAGAADPSDGIVDSGLHSGSAVGIAITGNHLTIRSTKSGDLNLDGQVSISDFLQLASNFNAVGKTWEEGDVNYDGQVTIADFLALASNFGGNYSGTVGAVSAADYQTLASFASSVGVDPGVIGSAVPEPASLGMLLVGAIGLMQRRRRRA